MKATLLRLAIGMVMGAGMVLAGVSSGFAQETVLRLHHFNSPRSAAQTKFLEPWAKAVEETSGGKVRIDIFPSMQLGGKQRDLIAQVRDGVVDLAYTSPGFTPGQMPLLEVFELPFVTSSNSAAAPAVQEFYETYLKGRYKGLHPIIFHTSVSTALHTTKPVRTVNDLNGLKLRAPNRVVGKVLSDGGAGVVNVSVPELTESISRGIIDGTPMAFAIADALRLQEVTDFHTDMPLSTVVFVLLMNEQRYESLPPAVKKAIDGNSGIEWAKKLGRIWDEDEKPGRKAMIEAGDEVIEPDKDARAAFRKLAQPTIENWIANTDAGDLSARELYEAAVSLNAKYQAQ